MTPLWIDHDGDTLLVDVRVDRVKAANMRERPAVAISIVDPRNPYSYLPVSGGQFSGSRLSAALTRPLASRWVSTVSRRCSRCSDGVKVMLVYFETGDVEMTEP